MRQAIAVREVGKRFRHRRPRSLARLVGRGGERRPETFWALRDVGFDVARGKTLGLIGGNGAGKSTLLRLLAGIGRPDEGTIEVDGRVSGIFELGSSFHPELTGREGAVLAAVIAGLSRRAAIERLPAIVAFAELEGFIDDPIRTYSTGMVTRLAFAVAIHVDADVLLIDEALSVGDLAFQERCSHRLHALQEQGVTMVIVSHSPAAIREFCDEVVWLRGGRIVATGSPETVTARYAERMRQIAREHTPPDLPIEVTSRGVELRPLDNRLGSQEARLRSVELHDGWGAPAAEVAAGGAVDVLFEVDAPKELGAVLLGVHLVRDEDGLLCLDTSTVLEGRTEGPRRASLTLGRLDLSPGRYTVEVGVYAPDWERLYDYHAGAYQLTITGDGAGRGVLAPPTRWTRDAGDVVARE